MHTNWEEAMWGISKDIFAARVQLLLPFIDHIHIAHPCVQCRRQVACKPVPECWPLPLSCTWEELLTPGLFGESRSCPPCSTGASKQCPFYMKVPSRGVHFFPMNIHAIAGRAAPTDNSIEGNTALSVNRHVHADRGGEICTCVLGLPKNGAQIVYCAASNPYGAGVSSRQNSKGTEERKEP